MGNNISCCRLQGVLFSVLVVYLSSPTFHSVAFEHQPVAESVFHGGDVDGGQEHTSHEPQQFQVGHDEHLDYDYDLGPDSFDYSIDDDEDWDTGLHLHYNDEDDDDYDFSDDEDEYILPHERDQHQSGHVKPAMQPTPHHFEHREHHHHHRHVNPPKFGHLNWVHNALSHVHAIICIVLYFSLGFKILREKTAVGISLQSLVALFGSEVFSCTLRIHDYVHRKVGYGGHHHPFDWSLVHTDFLSTILAGWCVYIVWIKFETSYEDQLDSFGLNFVNIFVIFARQFLPCCGKSYVEGADELYDDLNEKKKETKRIPMEWVVAKDTWDRGSKIDVDWGVLRKYGLHLGQLRPTGRLGAFVKRTYWLFLYIFLALPLSGFFFSIRRAISQSGNAPSFAVAYDDAVRAVALIPQLYMFEVKRSKRISEQLLLYISCEALLKIVAISYWLSWPLFQPSHDGIFRTRLYSICVQFVNLLIIGRLLSVFCNPSSRHNPIEKTVEMSIPLSDAAGTLAASPVESSTRSRAAAPSRPFFA